MVDAPLLNIDGLSVAPAAPDRPPPLSECSLTVQPGETHAILDRDGTGRSALVGALLGSGDHPVIAGRIRFRGDDITSWPTDVRAKAGLHLAAGNAAALPGVTMLNLLRQAVGARREVELDVAELRLALIDWMARLDIDRSFLERHVNEGLSASETWQSEILQLAMLRPALVVLDDVGPAGDEELDRHRHQDHLLETMARGLDAVRAERPSLGTLAITHSQGLVDHLAPDHVHVMVGGRIVASGGPEPPDRPETEGHESCT